MGFNREKIRIVTFNVSTVQEEKIWKRNNGRIRRGYINSKAVGIYGYVRKMKTYEKLLDVGCEYKQRNNGSNIITQYTKTIDLKIVRTCFEK